METTLIKDGENVDVDKNHVGYQPPQPKDTTEKHTKIDYKKKQKGRRNQGKKDKDIYDPDNTMKKKEGGERRDGPKNEKHKPEKDNNQRDGKNHNYKKQLRNYIKDDDRPNNRDRRAGGPRGNRDFNRERDMEPHMMHKGRGGRDRREMDRFPMSGDDFYIRPHQKVGRGGPFVNH